MPEALKPEELLTRAGELDVEGRWAEAAMLLKRALESTDLERHEYRDWLRTALWLHLGNALTTANDQEGAIAAYQACIRLAYGDGEHVDLDNLEGAYFNMGAALEKWGRLQEALEAFREARRAAPSGLARAAIVRVRLAFMRRKKGD
jgi:tetratricopeptide (TPR) repeat protein